MRLRDEEFGKRLREYSDDTMHLISSGMWMTGQDLTDLLNIITDSELNEEQVVEGLKKVLANARPKRDTTGLNSLFKYKSYYVYDFESETIQVAEGDAHEAAQELYAQITKDRFMYEDDKWAFDIALDCIRNMADEECARIKKIGSMPRYYSYGRYVINQYIHPCKVHRYLKFRDYDMSIAVRDYIYAILSPIKS